MYCISSMGIFVRENPDRDFVVRFLCRFFFCLLNSCCVCFFFPLEIPTLTSNPRNPYLERISCIIPNVDFIKCTFIWRGRNVMRVGGGGEYKQRCELLWASIYFSRNVLGEHFPSHYPQLHTTYLKAVQLTYILFLFCPSGARHWQKVKLHLVSTRNFWTLDSPAVMEVYFNAYNF